VVDYHAVLDAHGAPLVAAHAAADLTPAIGGALGVGGLALGRGEPRAQRR
jgi:hypothetical protein